MFVVGDRIRLISMKNDPDPVPEGTTGTVDYVTEAVPMGQGRYYAQVGVSWDNGRTLSLCVPPDIAITINQVM